MDWQDQLAAAIKSLEGNGCSIADNDKARTMLRTVRGFEQRLSRLSLRIADGIPTPSKPERHQLGRDGPDRRKPLYRVFDQDRGYFLDDPERIRGTPTKAGD